MKNDMRKELLYLKAKKRFPGAEIKPCGFVKELKDSFTDGPLIFWYNIGVNTYAEKED